MSILPLLEETRAASRLFANLGPEIRKEIPLKMAACLLEDQESILAANQLDLALLPDTDPKKDRLLLNPARIQALAASLAEVSSLPDPAGRVLSSRILPNGLKIDQTQVPLGVVGIIYESRPNVTVDVSALCLRSGNAVVLKGGKEAHRSNAALVGSVHRALQSLDLPTALIRLLPSDRAVLDEVFQATRFLDVLIPRGSDALIQHVRTHSRVPTIETGAGVVHTYVHPSANLEKALPIIVNAKTSRPSVCNALDCLLVDTGVSPAFWPKLAKALRPFAVRLHANPGAYLALQSQGYPQLFPAREDDFGKEWLDFDLSLRLVSGLDEALAHIEKYSSRHSEAILAEDPAVCARFLAEVDAAAVYANASTRFTDGGEFGLGAEIGISTQKLHARGPFALEKLVTEKWIIRGDGQIR